jgi:hypothetical protein
MNKIVKMMGAGLLLAGFAACAPDPDFTPTHPIGGTPGDSNGGGDNTGGEDNPQTPADTIISMSEPEFIFGFIGENRYSYCPSVIKMADGTMHMYYCGNPTSGVMVDNVYYMTISPDGAKSTPISVLQPGKSGTWDSQHVCDPSVIEGNFKMDGVSYKYAMFYLGSSLEYYYNETGVAFSNDLSSNTWIKYPNPIIPKTWSSSGDLYYSTDGKCWGTGQPSAISLDKKGSVLLSYTIGDKSGTRVAFCELDMSNMDSYKQPTSKNIVESGLYAINGVSKDYTCNCDIALNEASGKIVMIRPVQPSPTSYPAYIPQAQEIDVLDFSDFKSCTGTWSKIYRITFAETGFPRNHNACLLRDSFGYLTDWETPTFFYTVSKADPDVEASGNSHAEWTYHIYMSKIEKTIK